MKVLVSVKRVSDPHCANEVKVQANRVITEGLNFTVNPFDEAAVEAALRLTENGATPKIRQGEVVAVMVGPAESESVLRTVLACGANRAVHIEAHDDALDARVVAQALCTVVKKEKPDLVLLGRKTVDGEGASVGPMLASLLDWPMVSTAVSIREEEGAVLVRRQLEGVSSLLRVRLPAVVSVDLRVMASDGAYSLTTTRNFEYYDGIRFAALPAVMQARKKPLERVSLASLIPGVTAETTCLKFETLPVRATVTILKDVAELADVLTKDAARI